MGNPLAEGEISIVPLRLGLQGEIGMIVAGSERADFPRQTERLVLSVATNQAVVGLQEARLLSEQKRVARELDQRIEQRTGELAAANEELRKEITERQHAEAARRHSEEQFRNVVETATDAVVTIDDTGQILYLNPAVNRIFGYSNSELIGRSLTILMPEYLHELHQAGFQRYLKTGQRHLNWHGVELTALRKNPDEIVGDSPRLVKLLHLVHQVAPTDSNVLITGETGTGKELVARAIHSRRARKDRSLVKVNCGAIPAGLVESELFGHVKGAFTGATTDRTGRFELADGGTLFLDEIGELPLDTQVKLLRVLQEQEFEPVGSSRTIHVDVRIIAASNRNLAEMVREGLFRSDLFYRLNVLPLHVPPLRERQSDIPQILMFFLIHYARKMGKKIAGVSPDTMERLVAYPWPGNIRELRNVIERGVVLAPSSALTLRPDLVPPEIARLDSVPATASVRAGGVGSGAQVPGQKNPRTDAPSLEEVERRHILSVLEQTGWKLSGPKGAAEILKIHPNTLRDRISKLGITRSPHETP